jgi:hypothetical protein
MEKPKRTDSMPHSKPGSVDQQMEDTFPASDALSFSPGAIGAPPDRKTKQPTGQSQRVRQAEKKVRSGNAKKPKNY